MKDELPYFARVIAIATSDKSVTQADCKNN
jgi:hypothetical protein